MFGRGLGHNVAGILEAANTRARWWRPIEVAGGGGEWSGACGDVGQRGGGDEVAGPLSGGGGETAA